MAFYHRNFPLVCSLIAWGLLLFGCFKDFNPERDPPYICVDGDGCSSGYLCVDSRSNNLLETPCVGDCLDGPLTGICLKSCEEDGCGPDKSCQTRLVFSLSGGDPLPPLTGVEPANGEAELLLEVEDSTEMPIDPSDNEEMVRVCVNTPSDMPRDLGHSSELDGSVPEPPTLDADLLDSSIADAGPLPDAQIADGGLEINCESTCDLVEQLVNQIGSDCGVTFDQTTCVTSCQNIGEARYYNFYLEIVDALSPSNGADALADACDFLVRRVYSCEDKCQALENCNLECPRLSRQCVALCNERPALFNTFGPNEEHCTHFEENSNDALCVDCQAQCEAVQGTCANKINGRCPGLFGESCLVMCQRYPSEFSQAPASICDSIRDDPNAMQSCGLCVDHDGSGVVAHFELGVVNPGGEIPIDWAPFSRGRVQFCKAETNDSDCDHYFGSDDKAVLLMRPILPTADQPSSSGGPTPMGRVEFKIESPVITSGARPILGVGLWPFVEGSTVVENVRWWNERFGEGSINLQWDQLNAFTLPIVEQARATNGVDSWKLTFSNVSNLERFTLKIEHLSIRKAEENGTTCQTSNEAIAKDGCFPESASKFCEDFCRPQFGFGRCIDNENCPVSVDSDESREALENVWGISTCQVNTTHCETACRENACNLAYHLDFTRDSRGRVNQFWIRDWARVERNRPSTRVPNCCLCGDDSCVVTQGGPAGSYCVP